ncbi:Zn finger protein HypA/HybF involved in hydrogenase expression [Bradyrhizobium japonicum USDA 38]|nr:Zn finger protein HypA/HybF involved in hydrogenase expression [Bradyrhizobium japonicum USDA 38]MCS3944635.1 Zn finger protein HypA/HybF involved in hydrogenase expression [Bradyrhizobium japonicum]
MIETENLLEKCPRCGAWPMAANLRSTSSAQLDIRFRCPRCHGDEAGRLRRPFVQRDPPRTLDAA